jgi:succinate dehydrogenase/fumarate reductase-like Fe-S protein
MRITLVRNDPEDTAVMRRYEYELPDGGLSSISGALQLLSRTEDGTIGYYLSCRRGMCACCVVRANGNICMACVTPVVDGMVIEPIRLDIQICDTVVDLSMGRDHRFQFEDERS